MWDGHNKKAAFYKPGKHHLPGGYNRKKSIWDLPQSYYLIIWRNVSIWYDFQHQENVTVFLRNFALTRRKKHQGNRDKIREAQHLRAKKSAAIVLSGAMVIRVLGQRSNSMSSNMWSLASGLIPPNRQVVMKGRERTSLFSTDKS
jgi:hypothetical protein